MIESVSSRGWKQLSRAEGEAVGVLAVGRPVDVGAVGPIRSSEAGWGDSVVPPTHRDDVPGRAAERPHGGR